MHSTGGTAALAFAAILAVAPLVEAQPGRTNEHWQEQREFDLEFEETRLAAFRESRKDRRKAWREFEKDRREALREHEKDRREWLREREKLRQEAWREFEKARRQALREREKERREWLREEATADRENRKARRYNRR
jgi:hypothetical protein